MRRCSISLVPLPYRLVFGTRRELTTNGQAFPRDSRDLGLMWMPRERDRLLGNTKLYATTRTLPINSPVQELTDQPTPRLLQYPPEQYSWQAPRPQLTPQGFFPGELWGNCRWSDTPSQNFYIFPSLPLSHHLTTLPNQSSPLVRNYQLFHERNQHLPPTLPFRLYSPVRHNTAMGKAVTIGSGVFLAIGGESIIIVGEVLAA